MILEVDPEAVLSVPAVMVRLLVTVKLVLAPKVTVLPLPLTVIL